MIGIAEGHNSINNSGAKGIVLEDDLTLELSELLLRKFNDVGEKAVDLKPNDDYNCGLECRVRNANNAGVDLALFIHFNAYNGQAHGVECCVWEKNETADKICKEISNLGFYNRGQKVRKDLFVLRNTVMPAILIEVAFCDNKTEMAKYNANKVADAIVKAVTGKEKISNNVEVVKELNKLRLENRELKLKIEKAKEALK